MPRINMRFLIGEIQTAAFLDTIAFAEGTSLSPITQDDGYDMIVNSIDTYGRLVVNRFTSYAKHPFEGPPVVPSLRINSKGLTSNAAGRYQFMLKDWPHYRAVLMLPDFGPVSQDRYAEQLLKERGAIKLLLNGDFEGAVEACSNIWASLPGKGNTYGQGTRSLDSLRAQFLMSGGGVK